MAALTALLLLAGLAAPVLADSAEIPSAGQTIDPQVRVLLRRLQITDRIDVSLSSAYGLCTEQGTELYLPGGSQISFQLKEGSIFVYCGALTLNGGADLTLTRYADPGATEIGFRRVNYPALYQGDLRLKISEGALLPILTLHVEDYLLGVVPYEMSNSFPLEALKAQTVAARTYVLRKRSPDADYDVVDTTNDQVFRGYISGYGNAEKAVEETYGACGFYKGKLAQCYYAASNGGQTELVESVWPGGGDYGYYAVADDPYDVENPYSVVKSVTLQKSYTNEEHDIAPYGLRNLLATVLRDELTALGFDPAPGPDGADQRTHPAGRGRPGGRFRSGGSQSGAGRQRRNRCAYAGFFPFSRGFRRTLGHTFGHSRPGIRPLHGHRTALPAGDRHFSHGGKAAGHEHFQQL